MDVVPVTTICTQKACTVLQRCAAACETLVVQSSTGVLQEYMCQTLTKELTSVHTHLQEVEPTAVNDRHQQEVAGLQQQLQHKDAQLATVNQEIASLSTALQDCQKQLAIRDDAVEYLKRHTGSLEQQVRPPSHQTVIEC